MLILGIEGTAHTFGIGIIDMKKREILLNEKIQFKNDVGMDPRKLTDFLVANFDQVLDKTKQFLKKNNLTFKDIDLISFSQGPGIGNSLKISSLVAKSLALKHNIKLVGVNHIKAHLEIGKFLTNFEDPCFLYVSGVNTQVIAKDEFGNYKVYGETEDIGLGNLLDSSARLLGLNFPGGPEIEKKAKLAKNYIHMPITIKGMNVSFAGIYSFISQKIEEFEKNKGRVEISHCKYIQYETKDDLVNDLCFSLQETTFAMLMEIIERAIAYTKKKEFIIVGGVASNKRLTQMANEMAKIREIKYDSFDMQYAMDNGAMIAYQGYVDKNRAKYFDEFKKEELTPKPYITIESKL
jgi:glycoprotease/Kae1 family metallohydrolase